MNRGQDDKQPIEDKMKDDHLYRVLDKDTWMIDIIRAIRKMPLDHLDKKLSKEDNLRKSKILLGCTLLLQTWQ
jgi:hypothetical protein